MMIKKIECSTIARIDFSLFYHVGTFKGFAFKEILLTWKRMNWWTLMMVRRSCFKQRHWGVWKVRLFPNEGDVNYVYCITAKLEALELSSGILLRANDKCGPRYYEPQNEYLGKILQNAVGMTYLPLWFLWNKIKMWLIWCWIMTGVRISY